jgi:hypothetical protein
VNVQYNGISGYLSYKMFYMYKTQVSGGSPSATMAPPKGAQKLGLIKI